jgi:hypothetical protein
MVGHPMKKQWLNWEPLRPEMTVTDLIRSSWMTNGRALPSAKAASLAKDLHRNYTRHDPEGTYLGNESQCGNSVRGRDSTRFVVHAILLGPTRSAFDEHQDWFVKKQNQSLYEVLWAGWCLDMTHPAARAFLADSVRRITHEWGYQYLKPDAMWCGLAAKCTYRGLNTSK